MRLINIKLQHRMFFEEFNEPSIPRYAILSHTWEKEEISYAEASSIFSSYWSVPIKKGFEKIKQLAIAARLQGIDYIWVDTCCIDKSSSAELSEAINSMYRWYRNSALCCIYLADVPDAPINFHILAERSEFLQQVKRTRWLRRGWTLQELLAPRNRSFYSMNWQYITSQLDILKPISDETGIPMDAINDFKPGRWSTAQKMSWAADRQTTRAEDRAYSLLGIFNVNMPLIYGEGNTAFRRLQEEILKNSTDQTIFCWTASETGFSKWRGILARSPSEFGDSGEVLEKKRFNTQPFQLTNKGIQIGMKLLPVSSASGDFFAPLRCCIDNSSDQCGIYVRKIHDDNYVRVVPHLMTPVKSFEIEGEELFETIFAQPDLVGITWLNLDMCPRIAGFCFPQLAKNNLEYGTEIWIHKIAPKSQFSWNEGVFSFYIDPDTRTPQSTTARCHFDSISDCSIEIWLKYDWRKKYTENYGLNESTSETSDATDTDWTESECCEWKIRRATCNEFNINVSSWIELDNKEDAYVHVEFFDCTEHDLCNLEEWECSTDVTQHEDMDVQAAGFFFNFPVQASPR